MQRNPAPGSRDRTLGSQGSFRGGHNSNSANSWSGPREQAPAGLVQEQHVPVRGFNASEAKNALKRGMIYLRHLRIGSLLLMCQ